MAWIGALQIDSVNVLARAHLLTLFARLGAFAPTLLEDAAYRRRELVEYWAHEAAFIPVAAHPLFRHRMARFATDLRGQRGALARDEPGYLEAVLAELAERGPLQASELSDPGNRAGPWWGWSKGKLALEHLFAVGEIAVAERRGFARVYDLIDRVLPAEVLAEPTPSCDDARRALLLRAAAQQGVGTAADLADHYRLRPKAARPLLAAMAEEGAVEEVAVQGWGEPAYVLPGARAPRRVPDARLLCPFDPVVWCRPRLERLFGFHYRIEIYVPAARRRHGYYVLPFLLGDRMVGRVDLKAERGEGRLIVRGAWAEPAARKSEVAAALCGELALLAQWLGLSDVAVEDRGDLASHLRGAAG
jgi:uncharacterized protein